MRKLFSIFLFLLLISSNAFSQKKINTISPKKNDILFSNKISIRWNQNFFKDSSTKYLVEISNDSLFSTVNYSSSLIDTNIFDFSILQTGRYFYQIKLLNGMQIIALSDIHKFTYSEIDSLNNLSVLLKSDSGVFLSSGNIVEKWSNIADTALSAIQPNINSRPTLIQSIPELNGFNTLRFDGSDDQMRIINTIRVSDLRVIARWGIQTQYFTRGVGLVTGGAGETWILKPFYSFSTTSFQTNSLFSNISINNIQTVDFAPISKFKIIKSKSSNGVNFSNLLIGNDRDLSGRNWNGDISEIIGFSEPISDSINNIVDAYLCKKYSKELSLEEDVLISYGFCDTLFKADTIYQSYRWSNGDTTSFSLLKPNNTYQLTVTNEFGCEFIDEVSIVVPIVPIEDQYLCQGESFIYDTKLSHSDYNFLWSDLSSDSLLEITTDGQYFVSIIDTNGCTFNTDTFLVKLDSSLNKFSLGNDTSLCAGNSISLIKDSSFIANYEWSTGSQMPSIIIDTSGLYSLKIGNGTCFKSDSILINIKGQAPNANFSISNFCINDSLSLIDNSTTQLGTNIINWNWDFGDGNFSNFQNIKHNYNNTGIYTVSLEVENDSGCTGKLSQVITIHPKPISNFSSLNRCELDSTIFQNTSLISHGTITNYNWDFGDGLISSDTSVLVNPKYSYLSSGNKLIRLISISDQLCRDTVIKSLTINPKPQVDFYYEGEFFRDSTSFINTSIINSGSINSYNWDFGNGLNSSAFNPKIIYSQKGTFLVNLIATSDSSCANQFSKSISIVDSPPEFNTVFPKEMQVLTSIDYLQWNERDSSTNYEIQVAKDSNFTNIELNEIVGQKNNLNQIQLTTGLKYWRVLAKNGISFDTTNIARFVLFNVKELDSLNLWLRADTGVQITSGTVSQWSGLSDSLTVLTQTDINRQPTVIQNELNHFPVINFDNVDDQFITNVRVLGKNYTIASVYNSKEQSRAILMLRGSNNWIYGPYFGSHRVNNGSNSLIGKPVIPFRYVTHTVISENDSLLNYVNNTLYGANRNSLAVGRLTIGGNRMNGNIAEIVIINGLISNVEREGLDNYLMDKYAPPVDAGPDRTVCSFPDSITLDIDYALSFNWDTGDTTATAIINSEGKYFVTITDMFERISIDSVYFILDTSNYQVDFGFEDTTICKGNSIELFAGKSHLSYLWNTNDTLPYIKVDSSTIYSVSTTNCLGNISADSVLIKINNPEFSLGNDTSICFNTPLSLSSDSLFTNVSYLWSTGGNQSGISVLIQDDYYLSITDQYNCAYSDTIKILVDSSLYGVTIGPDTSLCVGNQLGITNPIAGINSYHWSNGLITPSITLDSSSNYSLTVSKSGCIFSDTALINLLGDIPIVDFIASNFCLNDSISFSDLSNAPLGDTLKQWFWDFGDGKSSNNPYPFHQYSGVNSYDVLLTVTTDKGCSDTISKTIQVYPLPSADFIIDNKCSKSAIEFTDQSSISSGALFGYSWNFGDFGSSSNLSNSKNPIHIYDTLGNYNISLISESDQGCKDTITYSKYINPTPVVDFDYIGTCLGDTTKFFERTILPSGSILSYNWGISWLPIPIGNVTPDIPNPKQLIPIAKDVIVNLLVITDSLCKAEHRDTLYINPKPAANFTVEDDCIGNYFNIANTSSIVTDSIVSNRFIFRNRDTSILENPTFIGDSIGVFPIDLLVRSNNGCSDSIRKMIGINSLPIPSFRVLNNNTGIPFNLKLQNNSINAENYIWSFGNGDTLHGEIPNYTYVDTGRFTIQLKAISKKGCIDSITSIAAAIPFYLDATIDEIYLSEGSNGFLNIAVQLLNTGNNTIDQIKLIADLNSKFQFQEIYNEPIFSGGIGSYQFNSAFIQNEGDKVNFVCVRIAAVNGLQDGDLTNNERCEEAFNDNLFVTIYPNPTSGNLNMDYVLPRKGDLRINIYDQLGNKVLEEINISAPQGIYKIQFMTEELKPGIYFYNFVFEGTARSGTFIKL